MERKTAIQMIIEERHRQVSKHGYDMQHDLAHDNEELVKAAMAYLSPNQGTSNCPDYWPFRSSEWHGYEDDRVTQLVKAATLIVAQIDTELSKRLYNE